MYPTPNLWLDMCHGHCPHREVFRESVPGVPDHVMGIVHGGACHLPELVHYLSTMHPDLMVKAGEGTVGGSCGSCDRILCC